MPTNFDLIVIGLGGLGSSVLAHLASSGAKVLGLDRFPPGHDRGSSHGESRAIRKAYFEHPDYIPLLERAYDLWRNLETQQGCSLYHQSGLVLSGPAEGEAISGARISATRYNVRIDSLSATEARREFPILSFPEEHDVVYEPEAGWLSVEDCVQAHLDAAVASGAETRFDSPVLDWQARPGQVEVQTDTETFLAGGLVITAGAWASQLIPQHLPSLRVLRKMQLWFPLEEGDPLVAWRTSPVFFFELPEGSFYGFPSADSKTIKLAQHTGGELIEDPSQLDRQRRSPEVEQISAFVANHLQGVRASPVRHAACMYTMSPDGHFLIDRHPQHENVWLGAGFSGHGFKFCSVLGEALADMATGQHPRVPVDFLSLSRFKK